MTLVSSLDVPALCIVVIVCQSLMVTYQVGKVGTHLHLLNSILCGEIIALILRKCMSFSAMYYHCSHTIISSFLSLIFSGSAVLLPGLPLQHGPRTCGCLKTLLTVGLPFTAWLAGGREEVIGEQYKDGFMFENKSV